MESLISVGQEIEYVKSYVKILDYRYNNKINFIWNIDSCVLEYKTIKLMLQPVIENSIFHGIVPKNSEGTINISCALKSDSINFSIEDDGIGFSNIQLIEVRRKLEDRNSMNIGLNNVYARGKIYFGQKFDLRISSIEGHGTIVAIDIPKVY